MRKAFGDALGKDPDEVGFTTDFFLDEGGTSLDFLSVIATLQNEFNIEFPVIEGKTTFCMKEIYEYIQSELQRVV